ncbi:MAG TPA: alpha-amylase family glycosyl hydrolase, partial [Vicinamibacterales bacterium]|nr:alpha-amylase family glycosyl hydrolase [Vicinamibacterales bacterium]
PDPASRFQPEGPHGPSEIVDAGAFHWTDDDWGGPELRGQIIYELHVGTFTRSGTWAAAAGELQELARIGITMIEVMPIAEFDGRFGWGYDGVDLFAPSHHYGRPDDFRRFVDAAHAAGVSVILDVVYNHLGPSGNYLGTFSKGYVSARYANEWGDALNFDGDDAAPVREFFVSNARHWIAEYHLDGLRLDATQQIFDRSPDHILAEIGRAAREAAGGRRIVLFAENEPQDTRLVRPAGEGGYGLDGLWNDDFHHSAMVALTGRAEAYYSDTTGAPQEFVSAAKYGYLFQGQHYAWQRQPRGTPSWGLEPPAFVAFLQNHDQVANSASGARVHYLTSPGRWRAMTALLLLGPWTPLLFQGQEFAASAPFLYFADFEQQLADAVRKGRAEFLLQFPSIASYERDHALDDPGDSATFSRCVLDFRERDTHAAAYRLHTDLIALRRSDAAFARQAGLGVDGSVLSASAFALRFFVDPATSPGAGVHAEDRLLIVNLGADLRRPSIADPLIAPPPDSDWAVKWSSEAAEYGGGGVPELWPYGAWMIPGESATVLAPGPRREPHAPPERRRTA